MVPSDGTPTFGDRESNQSFRPGAQPGATPADMPGTGQTSLNDTTETRTDLGLAAAAAENERVARAQFEHWNARDFDALEEATTDDAELVIVPFGTTLHGARTLRDHSMGWAVAFPDATVEVTRVVANPDGAVVEFIGRGTHTGPLIGPAGTIAPTGRYSEMRLCYVYEMQDGRIHRVREYYDTATLMRNLGLMA